MNSDALFKIILAIIPILSTIITAFVIPYIKSKINAEKLIEVHKWATYAVRCAEMIFVGEGMGEQKKDYVMDFLMEKFGNIFTEEQIDILIESAVEQLKLMEKELI